MVLGFIAILAKGADEIENHPNVITKKDYRRQSYFYPDTKNMLCVVPCIG